ncbi:hypothetical protein BCY88_19495 [Paraburkholderia fungorum]|uniref:Uncharacterized protein n=1 Tax=Paraburkholderia fungorum TaxID=134537 RepID=A0A420GUJ7_9BURK|nr:hypothetical protein BCY88_19495 [Paraburkholderia fungorum]
MAITQGPATTTGLGAITDQDLDIGATRAIRIGAGRITATMETTETTETAEITAAGMGSRTAPAHAEGHRLKAQWVDREGRADRVRHVREQAARRLLRHSRPAMAVGAATEAMRGLEAITAASLACRITDPARKAQVQARAVPPAQPMWLRCAA